MFPVTFHITHYLEIQLCFVTLNSIPALHCIFYMFLLGIFSPLLSSVCFLLAFISIRMASCYAYLILCILDRVLLCFNEVVQKDHPSLLGPCRARCHKVQPSSCLSKPKTAFSRTNILCCCLLSSFPSLNSVISQL